MKMIKVKLFHLKLLF